MLPHIQLVYVASKRCLKKVTTILHPEHPTWYQPKVVKESSRNNVCRKAFLESLMWHIQRDYPVTVEVV